VRFFLGHPVHFGQSRIPKVAASTAVSVKQLSDVCLSVSLIFLFVFQTLMQGDLAPPHLEGSGGSNAPTQPTYALAFLSRANTLDVIILTSLT